MYTHTLTHACFSTLNKFACACKATIVFSLFKMQYENCLQNFRYSSPEQWPHRRKWHLQKLDQSCISSSCYYAKQHFSWATNKATSLKFGMLEILIVLLFIPVLMTVSYFKIITGGSKWKLIFFLKFWPKWVQILCVLYEWLRLQARRFL